MRLASILFASISASCAARTWDGQVETWGTLRAVMHGDAAGRIDLSAVTEGSAVAIGTFEGLSGEFAILEGEVWCCRFDGGELWCSRGLLDCPRATLLVYAHVPRWNEIVLERDEPSLDDWLARVESEHGMSHFKSWPFVVEGELVALETHVLRGACPAEGEVDPALAPFRRTFARARGSLVGFYAPRSEGEIVHKGQRTHSHFVPFDDTFVAHVDSVQVRAGARLRLPVK